MQAYHVPSAPPDFVPSKWRWIPRIVAIFHIIASAAILAFIVYTALSLGNIPFMTFAKEIARVVMAFFYCIAVGIGLWKYKRTAAAFATVNAGFLFFYGSLLSLLTGLFIGFLLILVVCIIVLMLWVTPARKYLH